MKKEFMKILLVLLAIPFSVSAQTLPVMPYPYTQPQPYQGQVYIPPAQIVVVPQYQYRDGFQQQADLRLENQLIANQALKNQLLQKEIYKSYGVDSLAPAKAGVGGYDIK